jgi:hypothetical protein
VDTVVINSVIQYFPDLRYLQTVLEKAARVVRPGGRIFVGDVRHAGLLPLFHGATQLAKAPPQASARWLKRKVFLAIEQERELVIDPQFFLELPGADPRISGVDILLKRGQAHNELTRYRYDVVLHVGEAGPARSQPQAVWQAGDAAAAELVSRFDRQQLTSVNILNVPNRRLADDLAGVQRLWSVDDRQSVDDIRQSTAVETRHGCDPEDFWALSDTQARGVSVRWSPDSADGNFDVALAARDRPPGTLPPPWATNVPPASPHGRLATDPLAAAFMQQLGLELGQLLSSQLPECRLPAAVLAVSKLPSGAVATPPGTARRRRQDSDGRPGSRQMA